MMDEAVLQDISDIIENEEPRSFADFDWATYSDRVPEALLEIWKRKGTAAWCNGSYQTIDPGEYVSSISTIFKRSRIQAKKTIPYIISAFGRITAWHPDFGVMTIDTFYGRVVIAKDPKKRQDDARSDRDDIEILSGFPVFNADELNLNLYDAAVKKLGALDRNEIFAFVPALVFGGRPTIENVEKQKADIHFDILSQTMNFEIFYAARDVSGFKLMSI